MGMGSVVGVIIVGEVMGPPVKGLLMGLGAEKMLLLGGLAKAMFGKMGLSAVAGLWLLMRSCILRVLAGGLKKGLLILRGVVWDCYWPSFTGVPSNTSDFFSSEGFFWGSVIACGSY